MESKYRVPCFGHCLRFSTVFCFVFLSLPGFLISDSLVTAPSTLTMPLFSSWPAPSQFPAVIQCSPVSPCSLPSQASPRPLFLAFPLKLMHSLLVLLPSPAFSLALPQIPSSQTVPGNSRTWGWDRSPQLPPLPFWYNLINNPTYIWKRQVNRRMEEDGRSLFLSLCRSAFQINKSIFRKIHNNLKIKHIMQCIITINFLAVGKKNILKGSKPVALCKNTVVTLSIVTK